MKNIDIAKIRQLLKNVKKILRYEYSNTRYDANFSGLDEALALLPCETCNGTGEVPNKFSYYKDFPCPDCQKKPCKRCGGLNGAHRQVDDPQAGNSHMLTKMQCPLDK